MASQTKSYKTVFYPESAFGGFSDVDGTIAFYSRVNALVQPSYRVIDFGCGRGAHADDPVIFKQNLRSLRGKAKQVIGLDVDRAGERNASVDEFRLLSDDNAWPVDNASAELILCDFVVEHLPSPSVFFREAARVLAPGGYLCIRTINACSYLGLFSRLVPNRHHTKVLSTAQPNRNQEDVFPTLYRCNTARKLRRALTDVGFRAVVYGYEAEPSYLHFSKLAYALGVAHQRLAPSSLRLQLFAFAQSI